MGIRIKNRFPSINPILGIFCLALIVRLFISLLSYQRGVYQTLNDDLIYFNYALLIQEHGPFISDLNLFQDATSPVIGPGLPWILAVVFSIFGANWMVIFILNSVIGSLLSVLIYLTAKLFLNKQVAIISGLWSVFYVLFLKFVPTAGKDIWLCTLFALTIYTQLKILNSKHKLGLLILMAISFTLLIHIDERYFVYMPLHIAFFLLSNHHFRLKLKQIVSFSAIVLLLMTPWLIRNYVAFGDIVVLSVRTVPITKHFFGMQSDTAYLNPVQDRWYLSEEDIDLVLQNKKVNYTISNNDITPKQIAAMQEGAIPHRFNRWESYLSIIKTLWKPIDLSKDYTTTGYRFDGEWSFKHNLSTGLTYGILLPFAFVFLLILFKHQRHIGIVLGSILAWHTIIHVLFIPYTRNRYRLPIDFIIIILGIAGIFLIYKLVKNKTSLGRFETGESIKSFLK